MIDRAALVVPFVVLLSACTTETPTPPQPAEPAMKPPDPTAKPAPPRRPKAGSDAVEKRTVETKRLPDGETVETFRREDGSVALEVTFRADRPVLMKAVAEGGNERWTCHPKKTGAPECTFRDSTGKPLSAAQADHLSIEVDKKLEGLRKVLAPPDPKSAPHDDSHQHLDMPKLSHEEEATWEKKRGKKLAELAPLFARLDQLKAAGWPTMAAINLAKEELSTGSYLVPTKKPISAATP